MNPDLKWEVTYPHPAAAVWRALTDPAALGEWLEPEDDVLDYRLIEVVEFRRVSFSWTTRDCEAIVTFDLHPVDGGTNVRLRMDERKPIAAHEPLAIEWLRSYLDRTVADTSGHRLVFTSSKVS